MLPARVPALNGRICVRCACLAVIIAVFPAASQPELCLPPDRILTDQADSPAPVVFRHTTHVEFQDNRCLACHPQPFSILGRHQPITHAKMESGGSCGRCHNGSDATDVKDPESCGHCHTGGGSP